MGFKGCRADYLLDFLKSTESDYLYLVGDFVDMWSMRRNFFWPQSHNDVIRAVLGKAKRGTRVVYVPGNHDELLRDYDGMSFGDVLIRNQIVHTTWRDARHKAFVLAQSQCVPQSHGRTGADHLNDADLVTP